MEPFFGKIRKDYILNFQIRILLWEYVWKRDSNLKLKIESFSTIKIKKGSNLRILFLGKFENSKCPSRYSKTWFSTKWGIGIRFGGRQKSFTMTTTTTKSENGAHVVRLMVIWTERQFWADVWMVHFEQLWWAWLMQKEREMWKIEQGRYSKTWFSTENGAHVVRLTNGNLNRTSILSRCLDGPFWANMVSVGSLMTKIYLPLSDVL